MCGKSRLIVVPTKAEMWLMVAGIRAGLTVCVSLSLLSCSFRCFSSFTFPFLDLLVLLKLKQRCGLQRCATLAALLIHPFFWVTLLEDNRTPWTSAMGCL
jgi:hypothetical protein